MMIDELSAKRREKAQGPEDLSPRDALLEALEVIDTKRGGVTAKGIVILIRGETDDGAPSMSMVIAGNLDQDSAAGLMMRGVRVVTGCDHA